METVIVIAFLLLVFRVSLCKGFAKRSKAENGFYIACFITGGVILLLRSANVEIPDPTMAFIKFAHAVGIGE